MCQIPKEEKWNHSITGWMGLQGTLMVLFQLSPFYEHSTVLVEMGFMAGVVQRLALSLLVLLLPLNPNFSVEKWNAFGGPYPELLAKLCPWF